ncbi:hypothetical protein KCM76_06020 [Zooshikella marina]|uniref:polyphosphate kinase 2 family protein n=1 Tax=Zooshikella ganghwensis TaxID=202772 RepID=UPI001BAE76E8|nr:hypothetical protein [Zooshikella ganghwensis]MBU2705527.1 hypothetical protein [Zooshikella ganghwensis]
MLDIAYFNPPVQGDLDLKAYDPNYTFNADKVLLKKETERLHHELSALQQCMLAEKKASLLLLFQGLDSAGKAHSIKHVFYGLNPQGLAVHDFQSTVLSRAHDFLYRFHQRVPALGHIAVFSRSYYDDIIHELEITTQFPDNAQLLKQAHHINNFEQLLSDSHTLVIKFYLHISKQEHRRRLVQRIRDPDKHWMINQQDYVIQKNWELAIQGCQRIIMLTHCLASPWYIVPANHPWFRDWLIISILHHSLSQLAPQYPRPPLPFTEKDLP